MSDVFGSAGRVGYVAPSTCERLAKDFYQIVPDTLGLLIATLSISRINQDHVKRALEQIETAAMQLVDTGAEAVFSAGIPLVIEGGEAYDTELKDRLEQATGRPCATDFGTALSALRHLELENILLVTPFTDVFTEQIAGALRDSGMNVVGQAGLGYDRQSQYGLIPNSAPTTAIRRLMAEHEGVQGVYVPCGRIGDVLQISAMEEEFGVPVLTANQLMLWWSLGWAGMRPAVNGGGRLLEGLVEKSP